MRVRGSGGVSGSLALSGDMLFCDGVDALDWEELDRQAGIGVFGVGVEGMKGYAVCRNGVGVAYIAAQTMVVEVDSTSF